MHSYNVPCARRGVTQRIVNRDAGTHEWTNLLRRQFIRHSRNCFRAHDHVLRVTAIEIDPGDLPIHAHSEIAAPALIADEIMAAMPAHTDSLTFLPLGDAAANRVNAPADLMTRHARILHLRHQTFLN